MNIKYAFKMGFVKEMGARGIAPDALEAALTKSSAVNLNTLLDVNRIGEWLLKGLAIPTTAIPFFMGWQMAKTKRVSPEDIRALGDVELIKDYAAGTDALKRRMAAEKRMKDMEDGDTGAKVAAVQPQVQQEGNAVIKQRIDKVKNMLAQPKPPIKPEGQK